MDNKSSSVNFIKLPTTSSITDNRYLDAILISFYSSSRSISLNETKILYDKLMQQEKDELCNQLKKYIDGQNIEIPISTPSSTFRIPDEILRQQDGKAFQSILDSVMKFGQNSYKDDEQDIEAESDQDTELTDEDDSWLIDDDLDFGTQKKDNNKNKKSTSLQDDLKQDDLKDDGIPDLDIDDDEWDY